MTSDGAKYWDATNGFCFFPSGTVTLNGCVDFRLLPQPKRDLQDLPHDVPSGE